MNDPGQTPRYSIPEAARYVRIPAATLASWIAGRKYRVRGGSRDFEPLITRPDDQDPRLSFLNLIEAHALRALRARHNVPMKCIRTALDYASTRYGIDHLLLSDDLRTIPGEVFLERLGELINIGRGGQAAMKVILERFLERIDRDVKGAPLRLFPFTRPLEQVSAAAAVPKVVLIDPKIGSGRPVLASRAIRTLTISDRFLAGESVADLATDYGLGASEVEEAIRYEQPRSLAA